MAVIIGVAAAIFFALTIGDIVAQIPYAPLWWTFAAAYATFGAPIVVALAAIAVRIRHPWVGHGFHAGSYLLATASAPFVTQPLPPDEYPWIVSASALGPAAAALAFPRVIAWAYTAVVLALIVVVRGVASRGVELHLGVQDALLSAVVCGLFVALAQVILAEAAVLDAERGIAERDAVRRASAGARAAERARVDAVLHDTVLAALLLAARSPDAATGSVRELARAALGSLATRRGEPDDPVPLRALAARLRARVDDADPLATVDVDALALPTTVPSVVAEALADATAEAVRNARRHAPGHPARVTTGTTDRGLWVRVDDDGAGFDPASVPETRLGIRRSIVARVESLDGGEVRVTAAPGAGTSVALGWDAP